MSHPSPDSPFLRYRFLTASAVPPDAPAESPVLLCCGMDTIVAGEGDQIRLPTLGELTTGKTATVLSAASHWHLVATVGDTPAYAVALTTDQLDAVAPTSPAAGTGGLSRTAWRAVVVALPDADQVLLSRGMQVARWFATSRYCSACATPTVVSKTEAVATCPSCGHVQYPRLAPAMIVAVIRDGKILLGQSPRFRGAFHSVLAGFVEPAESAEDCVHREVWEEAGVRVKNIRYFGSQSWPMPHSLMLGFTAEWAGEEINIDNDELIHADWYGPGELPQVPGEVSIAGRMIRWFRETYG